MVGIVLIMVSESRKQRDEIKEQMAEAQELV
jgi:hypothetical protein